MRRRVGGGASGPLTTRRLSVPVLYKVLVPPLQYPRTRYSSTRRLTTLQAGLAINRIFEVLGGGDISNFIIPRARGRRFT